MPALKNEHHEIFAQALADGKPLLRAHELAGYKPDWRNANVIRRRTDVQQRINEIAGQKAHMQAAAQERAIEKAAVSKAEVFKELAILAFSDIGEIISWGEPTAIRDPDTGELLRTPNGELQVTHNPVLKSMDQLPDRVRRTIKDISFGQFGYPKIKLYSKDRALEKLGRELGMFQIAALDPQGRSTPEEVKRNEEARAQLRALLENEAAQWHRPEPQAQIAKPNGKGNGKNGSS